MLVRDQGAPFWPRPKLSAWRPERGGWIVRLGWRWTAWALSYNRQDLTDAESDVIATHAHVFGRDAFRVEDGHMVGRYSCGTEVVATNIDRLAAELLDHLAPLPIYDRRRVRR